MLGLLRRDRIVVSDPAALDTEQVVSDGVRGNPDIRAIATRNDRSVQILIWNYHDDDVSVPAASIHLTIDGLQKDAQHALLQHFRVDSDHTNPFAAWKSMGSPQPPNAEQYPQLESAGHLGLLTSPSWIQVQSGTAKVEFELPRQGLSLFRLEW
jgi:xylan 1,4-beta-xylosidase